MAAASRFATRIIHAGENRSEFLGAVALPIFQTSIYDERWSQSEGLRYMRLSNSPNHDALGAKLAALEGAETAIVTASGMAAIATSLLTILRPGAGPTRTSCTTSKPWPSRPWAGSPKRYARPSSPSPGDPTPRPSGCSSGSPRRKRPTSLRSSASVTRRRRRARRPGPA